MIIYLTKARLWCIIVVHEAKSHLSLGLRRIRDAAWRCPDAILRWLPEAVICRRKSRFMLARSLRVGTL